ncbi:MAG TPA: substrate-binding domain-containing protein, partial [Xanthobacteraceae bacterium]|nr:substrate-binding domain-containing protein [Xanthobacteraceae bacterium]
MKTLIGTSQRRTARGVCMALSMCLAGSATAADIRAFSSGAPAEVEKVLAARFAREHGHRVLFTVANPATVQQKLSAGEAPDIVILPAPIIDSLAKTGVLRAASRVNLARVGVGLVVREGTPLPDISTADDVRTVLLRARSIVIPNPAGGGQTGAALARMMMQLGIADAVKPKLTLMQAIAGGVELVAKGEVELGMFNISEILPVKGVTPAGALPTALQSYIVFAAAIHAGSTSVAAAEDYIRLLSAPAAREHWK